MKMKQVRAERALPKGVASYKEIHFKAEQWDGPLEDGKYGMILQDKDYGIDADDLSGDFYIEELCKTGKYAFSYKCRATSVYGRDGKHSMVTNEPYDGVLVLWGKAEGGN